MLSSRLVLDMSRSPVVEAADSSSFAASTPPHSPSHKPSVQRSSSSYSRTREAHRASEALCEHRYFRQFRLTDTGIADISEETYLVVTDDLPLYHALANDRQAVINFNHLRTTNW